MTNWSYYSVLTGANAKNADLGSLDAQMKTTQQLWGPGRLAHNPHLLSPASLGTQLDHLMELYGTYTAGPGGGKGTETDRER